MNKLYSAISGSILLLLVLALFAVSGYSQSRTFGFMDFDLEVVSGLEEGEKNFNYLKSAVQNELESRGWNYSEDPEVLINIGLAIKDKVQTRETDIREMHYVGQRNYHWEVKEEVVGTYKEGTVSIELVEVAENKRIWHGSASSVLTTNDSKMHKRIDKGIAKAFKDFPFSTPKILSDN